MLINYRSQVKKTGDHAVYKTIYKIGSLAGQNSSLFSVYFIENYCTKVIRIDWQEQSKDGSPTKVRM